MARKTRKTARLAVAGHERSASRARQDALLASLTSSDPETRCQAALALGRYDGSEITDALEVAACAEDLELSACARTALAVRTARPPAPAAEPTPERELAKLLLSPHSAERLRAIRELAGRPPAEALPILLPALDTETDERVLAALCRACAAGDDGTVTGRLKPFFAHRSKAIRVALLEGLWRSTNPDVAHVALPLAKDSSDAVRTAATVLLIRSGHGTSRAMAETMLNSRRQWMRLTALFALGGMTAPWARQAVIQHIRNVSLPPLVRAVARESIALAGAGEGARAEAEETVFTDLTRHLPPLADEESITFALESPDPLMRVHGLQNARRFRGSGLLGLLERQAELEADPLVLATLVKALSRVGGPEQAALIRTFLDHEDERVRANTIEALALTQPGPELDALMKSLLSEESGPRLRKQAAAQLFASDPAGASAHVKSLLLSPEPETRQTGLEIVASLEDDRLLGPLKDALCDSRREVHRPTVDRLARLALHWPSAAELLAAYRAGTVAGEVVDDEPVHALLAELNGPRPAARVRAMGRLINAKDGRVDTMLELNLGSRDPEVAHEASRVLRERHRSITLPGLYAKLARTYASATRAGEALVVQELADQLPLPDAEPGETEDEGRVRRLGKQIFDAFEDDAEMDVRLRTLCLEVRAALEQLGGIVSRATRPERIAAAAAVRAVQEEMTRAAAPSDGEPDGTMAAAPASGGGATRGLAIVGLALATVLAVLSSGGPDEEADPSRTVSEASAKLVDAIALESNRDRFVSRFRGKPLKVSGRIVGLSGTNAAEVRAGTVLFRVKAPTARGFEGLAVGQSCELTGSVLELEADGAIKVEGTPVPPREM